MPILESDTTVAEKIERLLASAAMDDQTWVCDGPGESERWQAIIDGQLMAWRSDPSRLEDEGIDAPSAVAFRSALLAAKVLRERGLPAPDRVVPSGDGGIVFARKRDPYYSTFEIEANGSIEFIRMKNTKVVSRQRLS
jgi:hypothetical protein